MQNYLPDKEELRSSLPLSDLTADKFGKLSEQVRRSPLYREAKQIFIAPDPALLQVRINAIIDQKVVVMPSPGLKLGFLRFKPNCIPFNKLPHALSFKGMTEFGEQLPSHSLGSLKLDLVVIFSEAVDSFGGRLGDGLGFVDLTLALCNEYGALGDGCKIVSVVPENGVLLEALPSAPWDIRIDGYMTPSQTSYFSGEREVPYIIWPALPKKRIRKVQPLWDLFCEKNPLNPD